MAVRSTFQCRACLSTYQDTQPDGTIYFHACGPLPADKNGVELERPNRRDENVALNSVRKPVGIKSEGAGVTCLTDPAVQQPAWVARFMKLIGREEENDDVDTAV